MFETIIVGAGPAGITASVYVARKKLFALVITKDIGGQAAWSSDIENYTGYQFITGPDLVAKFEEHLRKYEILLKENEEVLDIRREVNKIIIQTDKNTYETKTAIIASGKRSRELNIPGENDFKNKGLSYCATCDGPLFYEKIVAVIGGGNSALDAALQLMKICKKVYIINMQDELSGDTIMLEKIEASSTVTVLNNSRILGISGEKMLSSIKINNNAQVQEIAVQGVFVEAGLIPNSKIAKNLDKNELGEIKVNARNETSVPGIFAAGDVTDIAEKQIIIAAGEGAKAALSAFRYLAVNKI